MTTDLGPTTSIDVLREHIPLAGRSVIDVGCGDMSFSRQLVDAGASVLAVDPDAVQAATNRGLDPIEGLQFVEAGADALPTAAGSMDGVVFSFSLHHVPAEAYPAVFAEVRRVLRPGGFLCVIEPIDGALNQLMRHFHDEDAVRAAAQAALVDLAVPAFRTHVSFRYHSHIEYESFDAYAAAHARRSFNSGYTEADVRRPEVAATFERLGAPSYRFESPKLMMLLRDPLDPRDHGG